MIELFDKAHIIKLIIDEGMSLRAVSKTTGRDRKTVTKYYKEHMLLVESLVLCQENGQLKLRV